MRACVIANPRYAMYTQRAMHVALVSYAIKGALNHQIAKKESLHDKLAAFTNELSFTRAQDKNQEK